MEDKSSSQDTSKAAKNYHIVLEIPELLELVLCHVADWSFFKNRNRRSIEDPDSFIDLYHCSLVSKFWKSIIDTSPAISRKLGRYNGKQLVAPIDYHVCPLGSRLPTFVREGELYPTINYSFISWLAWRVPRCFHDDNDHDIKDLHGQYVRDKFPPSYFSNPPTTEVIVYFVRLKFGILVKNIDLGNVKIYPIHVNRMEVYRYPSQSFGVRNEHGVTVEDIVRAVCALLEGRHGEYNYDPDSINKSNGFSGLEIGIFKRTEQQPMGAVNRWSSMTRYGSFETLKDSQKLWKYEVSNKFKLFAEMKRD
ncbi:hypothetical protein TWF481_010983 [Arthrobotrys musiformis]|uniref:F-box domain-containing protein n=1 Tax=Arthrobotrys musiformis TaxID=47236 RepID=A0AAV9VYG6_9PEZI